MSSSTSKTPATTPRQTMQGHTHWVTGVVHLPSGRRIITCSLDGSLRLWDLENGAQIGEDWKEDESGMWSMALSPNHKTVASGSGGGTVRLWDVETRKVISKWTGHTDLVCALCWSADASSMESSAPPFPIGPIPPAIEYKVKSAALSADGKVLVTGCRGGNVYTWDIHAILKESGLEDLLSIGTNIAPKDGHEQKASQGNSGIERTPRSSLSDKSFLEADATRCHNEFGGHVDELPPRFFDSMEAEVHSSQTGGAHPHSSASALFSHLSSLLHRFRHHNAEATELPQPPTPSRLHLQVLLARLSSLIHRSPPENDAASELQQPSTPSRLDLHALLARLSSLRPRSRPNTEEETETHPSTHSGSRPDGLISRLSSLFRSQAHTNEDIELPQRPWRPHVVDVAPMRDREVLFVAQRSPPDRPHTQSNGNTIPGARPAYSLPVRMLAHLVLFLCCASPQHDGNAQPTQHQQQSQSQTQAPSLQTQPAAASTSTTPTAPDTHTTAPGAATAQPRPLPLRVRLVIFLCCASPPNADGH
ncbi:hypothetical protein DEU56DRAFT_950186 [Suillus clintonianus]|uniref:uncharacterized protein n=1 Tax=Suillus clintonianus TaxID=1904413 RepID=UPI001B87C609|nr:uncharacterized protein DEU56DRAFT_950186 [Suillus clintonianus]KAG2134536.1 hypothetical protein DEU56DRAFT_950186 [Suillus clintonianus]